MIVDALEALVDQKLTRVVGNGKRVMNDGSLRFDAIWLVGEKNSACLSVNLDTDEIVISPAVWGSEEGEVIEELACYFDKFWGWYWLCENSQGYSDMLIISTDGPIPQIGFCGIASAISVKRLITA
jgi:hypothetical protein